MTSNLLLFSLSVYGLGCLVSQSLMSVGGTLFTLIALNAFYLNRKENKKSLKSWSAASLLGIFWCVYMITNHFAQAPGSPWVDTLKNLPLYIVPLAAFHPGWKRIKLENINMFLKVMGFGYVGIALLAVAQVVHFGTPSSGFFGNPIYLAYALIPAFVFFAELSRTKPKALWVASSIALAIFLTATRMGWLCILIYLVVRLLPWIYKKYSALKISFGVILFFGLLYSLAQNVPMIARKIQRLSPDHYDPSTAWRFKAWQYNWDLFKKNPFFGVGPENNFIDSFMQLDFIGHWDPGYKYFAHSIYFQALADSGAIGFLLMLSFFGALFWKGKNYTRAVVLAFLFSGLTENILNNSKALHGVLFFTCFALLYESYLNKNRSTV